MTALRQPADIFGSASCIVVKIGSALVVEDGEPRTDWLEALAEDFAQLKWASRNVILVSSGAVALGRKFLPNEQAKRLDEKQAAAALGQPLLISAMAEAFRIHGLTIAQTLITLDDTEQRKRWLNARATLSTLLKAGAVPIINENDTVATDEVRYGDNDRLAGRVAQMVGADMLVLLSDVDGLYTADPRNDPDAAHIPIIRDLTAEHQEMAGDANAEAGVGSGGMATKLLAAEIAWSAGCATVITHGDQPHALTKLGDELKSTWIIPPISPDKAREIWLKGHLTPEGAVIVDTGAEKALRAGSSLLPVGVVSIEGEFSRGAAIAIRNAEGESIGKGITAYSSEEATRIAGLQTDEAEDELGYRRRPALIHRDDMVIDPTL